jgi:uncharacterized membrane protein YphA (DoxX/SURF4 family)
VATENRFFRWLKVGSLWLVTLLAAWAFGGQGLAKFREHSFWTAAFAAWGYPVWFRMFIGGWEIVAAILVVVPRLAVYGAAMIMVVMIGGAYTHFHAGQSRQMITEAVWAVLSLIIILARRESALRWNAKPTVKANSAAA